MTRNTRSTASPRVFTTSWMEISTTGVVSNGYTVFNPCGKKLSAPFRYSSMLDAVSSALAPVASFTAMPVEDLPLKRLSVE